VIDLKVFTKKALWRSVEAVGSEPSGKLSVGHATVAPRVDLPVGSAFGRILNR
jgi:hypothetical protein